MNRSLAVQDERELGGALSILVRQKRDHVGLDRLIGLVDASSGAAQQDALNALCRLVFPHAFAEESVVWPALRRMLPDGKALTLEIEHEHQQINELVTELERSDPDSPRHRELWQRIVTPLREDVRDEEDKLLPELQSVASQRTLVALGLAWRRSGGPRPRDRTRSSRAGPRAMRSRGYR